jgi:hypothetical protein
MFCFLFCFLCSELDAMMKRLDTRNQAAGALERCSLNCVQTLLLFLVTFFSIAYQWVFYFTGQFQGFI